MTDRSIAIVGASCRFPGADDLDGFWRLLESAGDAITEIDSARWSTRFYYHPNRSEPGKSYTWAAGLIDGVDLFEPAFFGISPREAAQMDPQQRILLELVWHALEDAGIPPNEMSGRAVGVYIGASAIDYSDLRLGDPAGADSYFMTGSTLSILANRVSYVFDLRGPSLAIDTACSSSLVALHHACEAIRSGRIESAVVGGVNLLLAPYPFIGFSRASMLSRRGRCFAFDERADGYVRGEGGAAVILKPLERALADNNPIRGVILASGVNSDGRTIGLSLPSEAAQASLLRSLYRSADIAPDDLAFFEMHGTGTAAGDPIEAAAVGRSLGQRRSTPLPIGSVKTNIGHLEPASGMAGLLKSVLALDHGLIPPTLHCETPNPNIPFDALNLRLVRDAEPVAMAPGRPCAGVNSFGFGGTNAHVILARPPQQEGASAPGPLPPLVLSAQSEASLRRLAQSWRESLSGLPAERMPMLLRAAARSREHHQHRLVLLPRDPGSITGMLTGFLNDEPSPSIITGTALREGQLAFVFSGNGAQFVGMGRDALRNSLPFEAAVEEVDRLLRPELGWSVRELLAGGADAAAMRRADVAQPLLFAVQVGIVKALHQVGVTPAACLGHSVGEIAAAWCAGALSLAEAGRVVIARSRYQQRTQGHGRMAALALAPDAAREFLVELGGEAELAALNASHSVTVSGPEAAIEHLEAEAKQRGLWFRRLDLDFAFHSRAMEPIREDLLASLSGLSSGCPEERLVSTVTGEAVENHPLDANYWWHNIRSPVRFADAAARLIDEGFRIFVEIGPMPILQSYLTDALRATEGRVLASLSRKPVGDDPFSAIAARCHVAGYDFTRSSFFDGPADPRKLPLYPWDRQRFWFGTTVEASDPVNFPFDHPLLGFRQHGPVPCWLNHIDEQVLPWLADHAIEGVPVLPAAGIVEMAVAAAWWQWPEAPVLEARDLELRRPLPFEKGRMRELRTMIGSEEGDWELASRLRLSSEPLTVHAVGRIGFENDTRLTLRWEEFTPNSHQIDREALYRVAAHAGLDYGQRFRTVSRIEIGDPHTAVAHLDPSCIEGDDLGSYLLHPAMLDGALQALLGLIVDRQPEIQRSTFLPWRFGRVRLLAPFGRLPRSARLRVTRIGIRAVSADIGLYDEAGRVVAELSDCWFRRIELSRRGLAEERALRVDLVPAPLCEIPAPAALRRCGVALSRLAASRVPDPARQEQALLLDALIGSMALRSILHLVDAGRPFTIAELIDKALLAPASSGLAECLLRLLERFGIATEAASEWRIESTADLPEVEEVWRLLLADAPDLVAELALTASAAERLPKALVDGPQQPDASLSPVLEHLLSSSPASRAGISLICEAIDQIAAAWPKERPLRILEVGAIGGGATRQILDQLARSGAAVSYVATNPDPEQAARLSFLAESFTGVSACHWSPHDGNGSLDRGTFDIILAINSCTCLQLDAAGLSSLQELLVSGGSIIAMDPEPNALWEIVLGQISEWRQGVPYESGGSPLRSAEEWKAELAAAGFRSCDAVSSTGTPWPWVLFWGTAASRGQSANPAPNEPGSILLVGGNTGLTASVRGTLGEAGHLVSHVQSSDILERSASDRIDGEGSEAQAIIFLAEERPGDPIVCASQQMVVLARVATIAAAQKSVLWVVTRDAQQPAPADGAAGVVGGALWGFARVLANETPRLSPHLIDFAGSVALDRRARQLAAELAANTAEDEIVWTPDGRHVLRVHRGLPPRWADTSGFLTLRSRRPGGLDALGWETGTPQPVGPGQVELDVRAAGLNFRDMMWAMGLLPEEALIDGFAGPTFGLECAGIVRSLGPGVEGFAAGDRVIGFASASLSTRVVTTADALTKIPPEMSFVAAATIPVTFVTAVYALGHLAKLAAGERVLIHAAAGGVGLAAIQYAKYRGAVVIATAGSEVKRSFLRLAGADHVLDSRDLSFANAVREITQGHGVDVVLNSLSGEAMERSLEILAPFGRFLELGKRDVYLNRRIHLRPLRQNISFFAIDIDQLPIRRPDLARDLLNEVSAVLSDGGIRPLAHRVFSFGELDDAFRLMQSANHIGKIVLVPDANSEVRLREPPAVTARPDGTYLVTGGVEGFGFEAARWLVAHGARSIALVSRRGSDTPDCDAWINELEAAGAETCVYSGDVADRASLAGALDAIRANQPPLRGIVHAASAIEDGLASELDLSRAQAVLLPKLGGALTLDALTRDDPIELFLLFSSATTLVGAPAQGAYVAANMAMEALARRRLAAGRPALAVAWGPIADTGYLAARPAARDALARRLGAQPIAAAEALAGLPAMIASGLPMIVSAETNWSEARRFLPLLTTPLFSEIRTNASAPSDESLNERLASLDPEAALALLKTIVAEEAATILRLPAGGIDPLRPLSEMGMDSLMAVELRLALENRLRIDLPLVSLAEGTSVASIATRLAATISTGSKDRELIALVARHEAVDNTRFPMAADEAASAMAGAKSVAAE